MSNHEDLQAATLDLLGELDLRQDNLLTELDELNQRLELVLAQHARERGSNSRTPTKSPSMPPQNAAPGARPFDENSP